MRSTLGVVVVYNNNTCGVRRYLTILLRYYLSVDDLQRTGNLILLLTGPCRCLSASSAEPLSGSVSDPAHILPGIAVSASPGRLDSGGRRCGVPRPGCHSSVRQTYPSTKYV